MIVAMGLTACNSGRGSASADPAPASAASPSASLSASGSASSAAAGAGSAAGPTLHYASNTHDDQKGAAKVGFNLFDLPPDKAAIDALGPGQLALVWLGNLDNTNCTPG